jgi:hypothetical protein
VSQSLDEVRTMPKCTVPGSLLVDILEERHDALTDLFDFRAEVAEMVSTVAKQAPPCPEGLDGPRIDWGAENEVGEATGNMRCRCLRCLLLLIPALGNLKAQEWNEGAIAGDKVMGSYRAQAQEWADQKGEAK